MTPDRLKIVVLDGHVTAAGLPWTDLEALGHLTVYDRTSPGLAAERCAGADAVLTNKVVLTADIINSLPDLKYIGVLATGYNVVDTVAARRRGIPVTNIPAYSTMSVAQTVFAHLLNIVNRVADYSSSVRLGAWSSCADFSYILHPITELAGLTMGIYGLGHIGREVARIAQAFGMKVIALTGKRGSELPEGIEAVTKEELFGRADVVSLNAPLTDSNRHFVNADTLALMKPGAILINTARGPLIDEQALADALNTRRIAAAGLDVLSQEPPSADCPLLTARNCFITPHIAWASEQARRRLLAIAASNLAAFISGNPVNVIN